MRYKLIRSIIGVSEALTALSAVGGGIVLLAGTYENGMLVEAGGQARFPLAWLENTPFSDYTVPALLLVIAVGGSALLGAVMIFTGRKSGVLISLAAGLIVAGYIGGELVLLRQGLSWIEVLYGGLGLLTAGLATSLWLAERRPRRRLSESLGQADVS